MPSISSNTQSSAPPVPSPSNPVLLATQSQWLFTDTELLRTPSILDGMAIEAEHTSRGKGVNFIMQVGILLKLPQLTLCTASVYLHRFFMRYSMVDLPQRPGMHPYSVAATALFLATKVEENCRKMRELIIACCRVALKQPNLVVDEQSKEFWKWRDTILHNEDLLLEALCFDLQLEQPYRLLYDFLCFFQHQDHKPLRNSAWAFINDSIYTVLCLQFPARTIAASALYAAARHCNISFNDDELGRPWWEQLDVNLRDLRRACNKMAELYERSPVPKPGQKYPSIPSSEGDAADKTRHVIPMLNKGGEEGNSSEEQNGSLSPGEISERKRSREPDDLAASVKPNSRISANGAQDHGGGQRSPKRQKRDDSETSAANSKSPSSQPQLQSNIRPQTSLAAVTSTSDIRSNSNSISPETITPTSTANPSQTENARPNGHSNPEHHKTRSKSPLAATRTNDKPPSSRIPASYQRRAELPPRPPVGLPPKPPVG
ncbi:conserved hypothetical protein [Uncinocarpus reesii 1704]|uniref:RNA polymerase II holoenzyme cyclin-like subunit n=1 Tax=Uncinocarpus reesii (strain UAMH 1704) TaxID=336963 RepID=C4JYT9_UNCRE|nr:uncharacterized protein UREG_07340 [Uncinocarpus reesii 1704]EEP82475.1 conserved hypothetical protein [Uncinocarpus reesii 1704]